MTINGRRDGFGVADLRAVADVAGLPRGRGETILAEVTEVVADWPRFAQDVGVEEEMCRRIAGSHRLSLPRP